MLLGRKAGQRLCHGEITGAITGIGDYRRALVQAAAAGLGIVIALLLSCIDYRSLVKVWPVHVALTWGLVLPTLFIAMWPSAADHRLQRR